MVERIAKGAEIELQIDKLAFGGKALARVDGYVIFLDRAVPGQTVRALITRKKRNYAEARVIETISQSQSYTPAPCSHFGVCGGCMWQNIAYEEQLFWKKAHTAECLEHIAGIGEVEIEPIIASLGLP